MDATMIGAVVVSRRERASVFRRPLVKWGLRLALLWAGVEVPACLSRGMLENQGLVYTEKDFSRFAEWEKRRDPVLGWSQPRRESIEAHSLDESGARRLPAYPDPKEPACISLYGDSFTWAAEVGDEYTWANHLARKVECRVASYGVPGYGTDQAYLRYVKQKEDPAKVVILGIFSGDITRNVNRYRPLVVNGMNFGLKPRFVLDEGGELRLLPVPLPDEAGLREIAENGGRDLEGEYFKLGTPDARIRWRFPHALSLARLLASNRAREVVTRTPQHAAFYSPDHPSKALPITAAIARAFHEEAGRRGALGAVVMIPAWDDLAEHDRSGKWYYQSLMDRIAEDGIPMLNAGENLAQGAVKDGYCSLYTKCNAGHFTAVGYRKLGEAVYGWLKAMGKP